MCGVCVTWCFCDGIQALCLRFSVVWGLFSPLAMEWEEEMGGGGRRGEQKVPTDRRHFNGALFFVTFIV